MHGLRTIEKAHLGITGALAGVAETGTVVIVTRFEADRLVSALPPSHMQACASFLAQKISIYHFS